MQILRIFQTCWSHLQLLELAGWFQNVSRTGLLWPSWSKKNCRTVQEEGCHLHVWVAKLLSIHPGGVIVLHFHAQYTPRLSSRRPTCSTRCPPAVARPWWQRLWCCRSLFFSFSKVDWCRLLIQELICYKRNVIFVLPYVSIVQEKVRALAPFALELGFHLQVFTHTFVILYFTHSAGVCWSQGYLPP